jgi:pimeloyl-ACP methyl ester carboxylesterase
MIERRYDTGHVQLGYAEGPAGGPPLVLLHGGSANWRQWEGMLPDLAARYHVFAPDLRGHGASGHVRGSYRLRDYAADVVAFLEGCVRTPAALFGHSLGGIVAVMAAARSPELASALVVGDAPLDAAGWKILMRADRAFLAGMRDAMAASGDASDLAERLKDVPVIWGDYAEPTLARVALGEESPWFGWMAANLAPMDPGMLTAIVDDLEATAEGYELETLLPQIRCPTLLLQADPALAGTGMADAEVARARELLPHCEHVRFAGLTHALHTVDKEPVLRAVLAFLTRHLPRETSPSPWTS